MLYGHINVLTLVNIANTRAVSKYISNFLLSGQRLTVCTHKSTDNHVHRCICSVADVLNIQKCQPRLAKFHVVKGL